MMKLNQTFLPISAIVSALFVCVCALTNVAMAQEPLPSISAVIDTSDFVRSLSPSAPESLRKFMGLVIKHDTVTECYPLITYVFFDSGSAIIPARYEQFTSPEQTESFSFSQLRGDVIHKHHCLLNIIGDRLRRYPQMRIKLVGCNSRQPEINEVISVSEARGRIVYQYLTEIWRIDSSRIKLLPARNLPERISNIRDPLGITENRRTEIQIDDPSANGWDIVKPIVENDLRLIPDPEFIKFALNNGTGKYGIEQRVVELKRDGVMWDSTSVCYSDYDVQTWNWGNDGADKVQPIGSNNFTAQLLVYRSSGIVDSSNVVQIPVKHVFDFDSTVTVPNSRRKVSQFALVLFKFDSDEPGPINMRILREYIYPSITKYARIRVVGYSDIVGLDDRNLRLSEQRAAMVTNLIKKNVPRTRISSIVGMGVSELASLYDNNLPEGRFFNRTVQVRVNALADVQSNVRNR